MKKSIFLALNLTYGAAYAMYSYFCPIDCCEGQIRTVFVHGTKHVTIGQPLLEIETPKGIQVVDSPATGWFRLREGITTWEKDKRILGAVMVNMGQSDLENL